MIKALALLIATVLVGGVVAPVQAQSDSSEFTISVFGAADTVPPATPSISSATPVADTQIDIVWGAVTDNVAVAGYVVFRDLSAIATTTLTNYSDTGLTPTTTYSYTVQAFDATGNYSTSSAAVATTTLATPVPPDPVDDDDDSTSQSGTAARPVLTDFSITPKELSAALRATFARPVRLEVRWGQSAAYELGASIGNAYSATHQTVITDLSPATTYFYEVTATLPNGVSKVVREGQFTTQGIPTVYTPPNVDRFSARAVGNDVLLSWRLPPSVPGATVRIVRNHYDFPAFLTDGAVVYQGDGGSAEDKDILAVRSPVYYTAFVIDPAGAVSSGAVAIAYASTQVGDTPAYPTTSQPPSSTTGPTKLPSDTFTAQPTSTIAIPDDGSVAVPLLSELYIKQQEVEVSFAELDITLDPEQSFVISIPKEVVGGAFKSIIATVVDPTDTRASFSYLLRINADQTAYEAVVAPLAVSGASTISVSIYNYQALTVATYHTPVTFSSVTSERAAVAVPTMSWWMIFVVLALLIFLLVLLLIGLLRRREE